MAMDGVGVGDVHGTGDGDDGDVCVWGERAWLGLAWLCSGMCVWLRECVWLCVWMCVAVCAWVRRGWGWSGVDGGWSGWCGWSGGWVVQYVRV